MKGWTLAMCKIWELTDLALIYCSILFPCGFSGPMQLQLWTPLSAVSCEKVFGNLF
uniref:Uncharacterized protein n=1 Tax=Physcomitrium patens TaxID=3218 RepID=A0A2K1IV09_PHYPA|nr:hypothetical protein PHYPA_025053 [Physcomitrium patens]